MDDPIGTLIARAIADDWTAGAAIRVEREGTLVYEGAQGLAAAGEGVGMTTLFDLASLSKLFTTTAILRLASQGLLDLDTPVSEALGYGQEGLGGQVSRALGAITLRSLLNHSSGIHYWYPFYTRRDEPFQAILADVLEAHPPTGITTYSDLNFMILGSIVESVTGKSLRDAMAEQVFAPLGMKTACYGPVRPEDCAATEFGNRIETRMVADLGLIFDGWRDENTPLRGTCDDGNCFYYFGGASGHAGVFSDPEDLAKLGRLYLDGGSYMDTRLLTQATTDDGWGRGLGFQFGELYPHGGFGHTGFTGTYLYINPTSALVVVLLTNRLHVPSPRNINALRQDVAEASFSLFSS